MIEIRIIADPSCIRTMINERNEVIGQPNEWLYFSHTELHTSTWKCPWKVPFRKNECDDRSDERKTIKSLITLIRARITDTTWVVHKIKMLQAVRVSCPRKFIINNHIFSSYRSLYKAPFVFLFSSLLCVWLSYYFIIASIHLSFVNFCLTKK